MTVTPIVPRARAPRRLPLRRLAATGATVAMLLGTAGPALATATPDPTVSASPGVAELTLVPAASGIVRDGEDLAVTATLDNGTTNTSAATTLSVALGDGVLGDRNAVNAWLAGDGSSVALREVGTAPLAAVATGGTTEASLRVSADDPVLADRGPGIYPVLATATVEGSALASPSVMIVPDDAAPAVEVGIVVPLTAPVTSRGLLSSDDLNRLTAADGALTAQLDAVEGTPAILAIDPAITAAVRVLGDTAPSTARAWLDRLMALPNARFALQFGDADLATQLQAGLAEPLAPLPLLSYLPNGTVVPSPQPSASETPAADLGPTAELAGLTDIGTARPNVYWPVGGTAGAAVVGALGALGTPEAPSLTLVPSATTTAGADGSRVAAHLEVAASRVLAYDSPISAALAAAADATGAAQRASAVVSATAQLTLADGGAPLLVTVDRGAERSRASLSAAIDAVGATPGVVPVQLSQLAASAPTAAEVPDIPADAQRVADLTAMLGDEETVARFATILDDPALLTGRERAEVLQLMGAGWRTDAAAAQAAVVAHREATVTTLGSVSVQASDVINLVSFNSDFPPYVRNDLPWPVNLTLVAEPDDPRLIVQTRTEIRAAASSNTRVEVPVEAQIANGRVTVVMQLVSPTGEPIGPPQSIEVEVHAEWETIGLVILGTLLALFIGIGIVRMVLRRRSAKHAASDMQSLEVDE